MEYLAPLPPDTKFVSDFRLAIFLAHNDLPAQTPLLRVRDRFRRDIYTLELGGAVIPPDGAPVTEALLANLEAGHFRRDRTLLAGCPYFAWVTGDKPTVITTRDWINANPAVEIRYFAKEINVSEQRLEVVADPPVPGILQTQSTQGVLL